MAGQRLRAEGRWGFGSYGAGEKERRRSPWGRGRRAALAAGWIPGALALSMAGAGAVSAQGYTITDLGLMGGVSSSAYGINNRGQVVGTITLTANELSYRPFLWQNGVVTDLGSLGGQQSSAGRINDAGQIVGASTLADNTTRHAFLWENGVMQDLGTVGDHGSAAGGINAAGQIAGTLTTDGSGIGEVVLWQNGGITDLGFAGNAIGINAAGQVAANRGGHAFLWQNGILRDMGTLGNRLSDPMALNERGAVVGISILGGTDHPPAHAFLADNDGMHDLGSLGGDWSYAFALNNQGDVVGYSNGPGFFLYHAFLYSGGIMQDLNALIPAGSGWVLTGAYGINDYGQIVGAGKIGGETHAYLLNPPPPAAPDGLTASVLSDSRIALSWRDNSSDETGFSLWRRSDGTDWSAIAALDPNTTTYTDRALAPGVTYTYRVRATGLGGASDWSGEAAATTQTPAVAPPAFLFAHMAAEGAAQLAWSDNSDNETAFAIWRKGGGSDWARVGATTPNSTAFTDHGLQPATTYTYRVRAISGNVASVWSNEAILTTPPRPAAPSGLTASWIGTKSAVLSWTSQGANVTGIALFRKTGYGDWQRIAMLPPGATYTIDFTLSPQTSYTYRLRTHNNDYASDWSNEVSITTPALP